MYWIRSCSPRFAWPSTAAYSLDQGEQTSKDNDQGCKLATRAAALAHPSLRRSGPFCCARLCGFPSQKLFPVACPVLWGHGCRWKRMGFCGGKTFRWLPWAKHLEGKLCWSCGHLPTHTLWLNITCFLWIVVIILTLIKDPHLSSLPWKRRAPIWLPVRTSCQV